jgi:hypothetical protein
MSKLKIHENGRNFILNGQNFFYLADTVWSAFTNATMEEWEFYLEKRWSQGYTVLQINTLPQWDRCLFEESIYPFHTEDGQKFDFDQWNEDYYIRARRMCKMAVDRGFQLALVVLWLNYVPGTWGSRIVAGNVMPKDLIRKYAGKVVDEFEEFDPIYLISGDTDFDTDEAIAYYEAALDVVCEKSPESLKAMHVKRGYDYIPEQFLDRIGFYMYQSGHNADGQEMAYLLAEHFYKKYPQKPIINAEPCYEQMGYSRRRYGRFQPYDIRKAAWSGILSGACAGVAYGAHGVWNWKKTGKRTNPVLGEGFDESFPVQEALDFPGAWDYGFIGDFMETKGITELKPVQELLEDSSPEIRMAQTEDERYLIYIPYTTSLVISKYLDGYHGKAIDLDTGRAAKVKLEGETNKTLIYMHGFQKDALIFLWK